MSASRQRDPWRYAAFLLWAVFFIAGLSPEPVFFTLRQAGGVITQRALVNSPHIITIVLAGYVALFVYHRCRGAGDSSGAAQDKALQMGVVAFLAFMPVDLGAVLTAHNSPILEQRVLLYGAALLKLVAWWSLLALFIRYYLFKVDGAFAEIGSLFPSTRGNAAGKTSDVLDKESGIDLRDGKE